MRSIAGECQTIVGIENFPLPIITYCEYYAHGTRMTYKGWYAFNVRVMTP